MTSPPDRDPFVTRLPGETRLWQDRGIITSEQALDIVASYDVPIQDAAGGRARSKLVTILAIFGSLLVGLGVILFFAANWDGIPREIRLALIVIGIPSVYGAGYWLRYMRGYWRVGMAVLLLAALLYGAGIHLVAQAYNFPLNDPGLFTLWFLGVLPLAYLTRSQAILILALALFLSGIGFWLADGMNGSGEDRAIFSIALYLSVGPLIYGLGKLQARFDLTRSHTAAYEIVGLVVTLAAIYLLAFRFPYESSSYQESGLDVNAVTHLWVVFYLAGTVALIAIIGAVVIDLRRRSQSITLRYEAPAALIPLAAAYLVIFVGAGNDVLYPVVFNILLLAGIIGLVFAGYFWRRESFINVAIVFFGLDIFTRYFELSWGLLDRSLVFVVAGLILIGGGFLLERGRNRVIQRMGDQGGVA